MSGAGRDRTQSSLSAQPGGQDQRTRSLGELLPGSLAYERDVVLIEGRGVGQCCSTHDATELMPFATVVKM